MTNKLIHCATAAIAVITIPVSAATKHHSKAAVKTATSQHESAYSDSQYSSNYYSNSYYPQQQYYGYSQQGSQGGYYTWPSNSYNWNGYYNQQQPAQTTSYNAGNDGQSRTDQRGLGISAIYTLRTCPHCMELESSLQQSGVKLNISGTNQRYYGAFPTVVYTDGTTDHGDRIYGGSVRLPGSVRIIETN